MVPVTKKEEKSLISDYYQIAFRYDIMHCYLLVVLELFGKETVDRVFRGLEQSGIFLNSAEDDDNYYKEKRNQQLYTIDQVCQGLKEIFGTDGADLLVSSLIKVLKKNGLLPS